MVLEVVPAMDLDFDIVYTVVFGANAVEDLVGIAYDPIDVWTLSIEDNEFLADCLNDKNNYTPLDGTGMAGTTPVEKDVKLMIDFCEKVVTGAGAGDSLLIYELDGTSLDNLFAKYAIEVFENGDSTAVINVVDLKDNTTYGILIDAGAVLDENGNAYAGIQDPTFWNIRTGDNTAPVVVSLTPDTDNLPNTFTVDIEFSENVLNVADNVTVSSGTVTVTGSGTTYVAEVTAADGEVVELTVGTGVIDASNRNNLEAPVTGTYTVGDNTAPTLVFDAQEDPQTTLFTVGLTFSEPVKDVEAATSVDVGEITLFTEISSTLYSVTISADEESVVTLSVANTVTDLSVNENAFAGGSITLTVGDFTAPTV
jgi:hypothetical protein